jgi:hypothetical protein
VESFELVNHYLDLSSDTLQQIKFDGSQTDNQLRLIFCLALEKSFDSFADEIYKKENFNIEKFSQMKPISKFRSIYDNYPSYGLVNNQFRNDGFITLFKESFEKEIEQDNLNLITSSSTNSLKKFISLLDMYKQWINLFRKMHEEC